MVLSLGASCTVLGKGFDAQPMSAAGLIMVCAFLCRSGSSKTPKINDLNERAQPKGPEFAALDRIWLAGILATVVQGHGGRFYEDACVVSREWIKCCVKGSVINTSVLDVWQREIGSSRRDKTGLPISCGPGTVVGVLRETR